MTSSKSVHNCPLIETIKRFSKGDKGLNGHAVTCGVADTWVRVEE